MSFIANTVSSVFDTVSGKGATEAAQQAAEIQAGQFGQGIEEQRRQFDITQGLIAPQIEAGDISREQQLALLQQPVSQFSSPISTSGAQEFIQDRQRRALLRSAAATGQLGGGRTQTALQQQAAGFASQDLQNQFNRELTEFQVNQGQQGQRFNQLGSLAGGGQVATGQVGQFGQATAGNVANLLGQQGAAQAGGVLGAQQGRAQGLSNAIKIGSAIFSDSRLKKNIEKIGTLGSLNIYNWLWKDTNEKDSGFIAQEVKEIFPELVKSVNGFLAVDYNKVLEAI